MNSCLCLNCVGEISNELVFIVLKEDSKLGHQRKRSKPVLGCFQFEERKWDSVVVQRIKNKKTSSFQPVRTIWSSIVLISTVLSLSLSFKLYQWCINYHVKKIWEKKIFFYCRFACWSKKNTLKLLISRWSDTIFIYSFIIYLHKYGLSSRRLCAPTPPPNHPAATSLPQHSLFSPIRSQYCCSHA